MAAPKKTLETNPELAFVDVDLLDLYRRLTHAHAASRAVNAGIMAFIAAVREGHPLPNSRQQAEYRKVLRQLLELEAGPPPKKRGTVPAGANRAMPGLIISAGRGRRKGVAAQQMLKAAA